MLKEFTGTSRAVIAGLGTSALLLISSCSAPAPETPAPSVSPLEVAPVSGRSSDLMVTVYPDHLRLANPAGEQVQLAIPEGSFYLSIAPGTDNHHSCGFHSLTTCIGERRNTPVSITVTDASGATLLHREVRTGDNGRTGV